MAEKNSNKLEISAMKDFATDLADAASAVTLKYFRSPLHMDIKADQVSNIATVADAEAENEMVRLLQKFQPINLKRRIINQFLDNYLRKNTRGDRFLVVITTIR